jgi:hypothetical protein
VEAAGQCVNNVCQYVNPLNASNPNYPLMIPRSDSSLVFLAGIVGVPWQDIATDESLSDPNVLEYLRTTADPDNPGVTLQDRWAYIVGEPDDYAPPADPFMIESVAPRDGLGLSNPVVGVAPQATTAPVDVNNINGHEYTIADGDDLQYACIFQLGQQRDCATATGRCDCKGVDAANPTDKPLCQAPGTSNGGDTQYFAKAYPGIRFLKVLKEYGMNSIVASVCPKITNPDRSGEAGYGYNPAVKAIIDRLKEKLHGACLPRALQVDEEGNVACQVVEATNPQFEVTCDTLGRGPVDPTVAAVVRKQLEAAGRCGNAQGLVPCQDMQLCALQPAADQDTCLNSDDVGAGPLAGYCYIDAMPRVDENGNILCETPDAADCIGNPALVEDCEESQRRLLRIISVGVNPEVPYRTSTLYVACQGKPLGS